MTRAKLRALFCNSIERSMTGNMDAADENQQRREGGSARRSLWDLRPNRIELVEGLSIPWANSRGRWLPSRNALTGVRVNQGRRRYLSDR